MRKEVEERAYGGKTFGKVIFFVSQEEVYLSFAVPKRVNEIIQYKLPLM